MGKRRFQWAAVWVAVVGLSLVCRAADPAEVGREIEGMLAKHGDGVAASAWVGGAKGAAWFEREAAAVRPTASAVKTFFLVELFDQYRGRLDEPLEGAEAVLGDDSHPAIAHFSSQQREEIRKELGGKSVRYVARAMMGQEKVSNIVYNAAANVVMAALGGPEKLTEAIHRRDRAFESVAVRRYMLRDRQVPGDNEATAGGIAALYQHLASKELAGVDEGTMGAVWDALYRGEKEGMGKHYDKVGDLQSDPLTGVRAGWWETAAGPVVYVVMVEQPNPGQKTRSASGAAVSKLAYDLADKVARVGARAAAAKP
jgi:hypothetical protein